MDHTHCGNCINVKKCKRSRGNGCEIISCKLDCLAEFHVCKEDEHSLLCKNERVSCINVEYGCKKKMKRFECGQHLAVCPASVVICSKEWNRWSINAGTDGNLEDYTYVRNPSLEDPKNDHQLDTSLALDDQHSMMNMCEPYLPTDGVAFGIHRFESPARYPNKQLVLPNKVIASLTETQLSSTTTHEYIEQIAYAHNAIATRPTPEPNEIKANVDDTPDSPAFLKLSLDTVLDCSSYYRQPVELITFRCGQGYRRDMYTSHCKNVHDEIHAGLNGWLQERCPLASYGCNYSRHRFYPDKKGYKVIYSSLHECMAVKTCYPGINDTNSGGTTGIGMVLTDLPSEVLEYMTLFLDSFSMCNLALTNTKLRGICESVLQDKGIVVQKWQRVDKPGTKLVKWKPLHKCWMFSKGFSLVKRWGFEDNNPMSDHLEKCPFNDRNVKEEPYLCDFFGLPADPWLEARLSPSSPARPMAVNQVHETLIYSANPLAELREDLELRQE